jgi:hypothetical protein
VVRNRADNAGAALSLRSKGVIDLPRRREESAIRLPTYNTQSWTALRAFVLGYAISGPMLPIVAVDSILASRWMNKSIKVFHAVYPQTVGFDRQDVLVEQMQSSCSTTGRTRLTTKKPSPARLASVNKTRGSCSSASCSPHTTHQLQTHVLA